MRWAMMLLLFSFPVWGAKVLLIESYHSEFEWDKSYVQGIQDTLQQGIELETYQMDTKRVPPSEYEKMAELAFVKYIELNPDVVILGDDNALKYMWPMIFDDPISVVFLGINSNPREVFKDHQGQAKVTGVLERPLFVKTIGELKHFLSDKEMKVRIMFDSGVTSNIARQYIERQYLMIKHNLGVEIEIVSAGTKQEWQKNIVSAADENFSVIIVGLYQTLIDREGNNVPADDVITWTHQNSELPVFAFWDFAVASDKAAGGVVLFGNSQGVMAGTLVNRIVNGESARSIPIQIGNQGKAIYSTSAMERWSMTPPEHWKPID
ncbi:ABC transporter substrate-binding protein [Vibrio ouci]|uniref:Sugar ABC transporter ATPase n=1 Tax=Vibrio ouci TaxID=2499078 RepID=A0A4Y8WFQ0_9VIBR|nr:ABC transporter substrate binding protein [Vibrio ouci]TFH91138.1 hypothetical protein ELS82_13535 [Vibrio ouci]